MIHVATVHHFDTAWIDLQREHFDKFAPGACIWGSLNIDRAKYADRFDVCSSLEFDGRHASKLDHLAALMNATATDDDFFVFIDGDAFLLGDIQELIDCHYNGRFITIQEERVQRIHPAFCLIQARHWRMIENPSWEHVKCRMITRRRQRGIKVIGDPGGGLIRKVEKFDLLDRMRSLRDHECYFSVYGKDGKPIVYHHGAWFRRSKITKQDRHEFPKESSEFKEREQKYRNAINEVFKEILDARGISSKDA